MTISGGKMKLRYIPNILSLIRLLLVPVFIFLFLGGKTTAAVAVFIFSGFTDVLDGYIARKYNFISNAGKVLDPLADKLTQMSAFVCLYITELVPVWMPVVYFFKELATAIGAFFVFRKGNVVVKSHIFGKLATFLVFAFVSVVILFGDGISQTAIVISCIFMCVYFLFSCLMYVNTEMRQGMGKAKKENGSK